MRSIEHLSFTVVIVALAAGCGSEREVPAPGDRARDGGAGATDAAASGTGSRGASCYANGSCNAGLTCDAQMRMCGWIFEDTRNAGAEGAPCRTSGEECSPPLSCMAGVCGGPEIEADHVSVERSGAELRFGWTFGARAAYVFVVRDAEPSTLVWGLRSQVGLSPPVVFGSTPAGAEVVGSSAALTAGTAYRVVVLEQGVEASGAATMFEIFTP